MNKNKIFLLMALCLPALATADGSYPGAPRLTTEYWATEKPVLPQLKSPLIFARKAGTLGNGSRQIMSLIQEQDATTENAHAWPLYVQLDAANDFGHNAGITSRMYNRGMAWAAGMHTEAITYSDTTAIGFNAEMSPMAGNPRSIGINLQAKNGYATPLGIWSDSAVNIQSEEGVGWDQGILLDGVTTNTGIEFGPTSTGLRALWVRGMYAVGLDMGSNSIRLNAGTKVCFENGDRVCMRLRGSHIEFLNGNSVLGYLDTAQRTNKCLNC